LKTNEICQNMGTRKKQFKTQGEKWGGGSPRGRAYASERITRANTGIKRGSWRKSLKKTGQGGFYS